VYGRAYPRPGSRPEDEAAALRRIERQALHAWALRFRQPVTGGWVQVTAPPPRDLCTVLAAVFGEGWSEALPADPFGG